MYWTDHIAPRFLLLTTITTTTPISIYYNIKFDWCASITIFILLYDHILLHLEAFLAVCRSLKITKKAAINNVDFFFSCEECILARPNELLPVSFKC
jgi:hypothetical protein